jgi:radical SAM superfamily enzyme YgiQ (UPF0313 family)
MHQQHIENNNKRYPYSNGSGSPVIFFIPDGIKTKGSPGLLPFLGSMRRQGIKIDIVLKPEDIFQKLQRTPESVVALSAQEKNIHHIAETACEVRRKFPTSWIVVGGPLVEYYKDELLKIGIDIIITGEADIVFPLVLKALPKKRPFQPGFTIEFITHLADAVKGYARLDKGSFATSRVYLQSMWEKIYIIEGRFLPSEKELQDLWMYPWDIYRSGEWTTLNLHTQRGCTWNRCSFCTSPKVPMRRLAPVQVIDVIDQALNEPVQIIAFSDDTFLQNTIWTTKVLEGLKTMNLRGRIDLFTQVRVSEELESFLPLFADAGFAKLEIGVETLIPYRAKQLDKCINGEEYCRLARHLVIKMAQVGIIPQLNIILSDPESTPESIGEEIRRLCELVDYTHRITGVAPTFNFNLTIQPSRGSRISRQYPYTFKQGGELSIPNEFILSDEIALILTKIVKKTESISRFAASFELLEVIIDCLESFLSDRNNTIKSLSDDMLLARQYCMRVRKRFESQFKQFILQRINNPVSSLLPVEENCQLPPEILSIKDWLSGYHAGVDLFSNIVQGITDSK